MEYKSVCKACGHNHYNYLCNWQILKKGTIKLKPWNSNIWGVAHTHEHKQEFFDFEQETECGCRFYIPSDNLEYLEWKYEESK